MQEYVKKMPKEPSFRNKDFFEGYTLNDPNSGVEIDYINMLKGHEYYQIESKSIHVYYILEGEGIANINGTKKKLMKGDIVEIPINVEYAFAGKLKMIEIMCPPFDENTHTDTRLNDLI